MPAAARHAISEPTQAGGKEPASQTAGTLDATGCKPWRPGRHSTSQGRAGSIRPRGQVDVAAVGIRGSGGQVRNAMGALQRWSGRHRGRVATIGLAAVLMLLAGFSLWAAVRTNVAARQVDRDSTEQDVWQNARVTLANAEFARHGYVEHQRVEARADVAREMQALREALQYIVQHADPDEVSFARQVGEELAQYQEATARLLAAVAVDDTARVEAIEVREVEPLYVELAEQLDEGAQDEQEQVRASIGAQRKLGGTLLRAVPVVFTVGPRRFGRWRPLLP